MIPVKRLNHAVLYVRDAQASSDFYQRALGFTVVGEMGRAAAFLRASASDNHHDLAEARKHLSELGALVGESDHGVTKSLYAKDPDGNEFEVMWAVPRDEWGALEHEAVTKRLDLANEVTQRG